MEEDVWEVDGKALILLTLNDIELLEGGLTGSRASKIKELLDHLVKNKTAEEIGSYSLLELKAHIDRLQIAIKELAVPKASATP